MLPLETNDEGTDIYLQQQPLNRSIDDLLEKAYVHGKISRRWALLFLSLGIAASADAVEIHFLSFVMVDQSFQNTILKNQSGEKGTLAASIYFGMMFGGILSGILADYYLGRKESLQFGLVINAFAGISTAVSPNLIVLSITRALGGVGIGATIPPLFALATEFAPQSKRGLYVTLVASFFMVGSVFVAAVAWTLLGMLHASWRVFAAVCSLPCIVGAFMVTTQVPESPRYLALHQHYTEATTTVNKIAAYLESECDDESDVHNEVEEITVEEIQIQFHRRNMDDDTCTNATARMRENFEVVLTLYNQETRRTILPLQLIWFLLCFSSYGLITWINSIFEAIHLDDPFQNAFLFAAAYFPGNVISWLFTDRLGRKWMLSGSLLLSGVSLSVFASVTNDPNRLYFWVILSACSFQACTCIAWNTLETLTGEDFCTVVRSTAFGICTATGRIGAILAQFVNSKLIQRPSLLLLVSSGCLFLGAVAPWIVGTEDKTNKSLQDDVVSLSDNHFEKCPTNESEEHALKISNTSAPDEILN